MEGQTVSHYRVLARLGGGGMGDVYKAMDTRLRRPVALKFLPRELTRDDAAKQRFLLEARAASALDHNNICVIHEVGETPDGQLFLAMAYYEGETLADRIARGPLPVEDALDIAIQIADGLAKAHEAGIVHRDIKPANLMLTADGVVKILDFGIAKLAGQTALTRAGGTPGTPAYMAPELFNGQQADGRADLWALGAVLHEMLGSDRPFRGESAQAVTQAILHDKPRRVGASRTDVPRALARIVTKALAKNREKRYGTAAELRQDLADCREALTAPSRDGPFRNALRKAVSQPRIGVPVLASLTLLAAGAFWIWGQTATARWAREVAIPEIRQLADSGDYWSAVALAEHAEEAIPGELEELWPEISRPVTFEVMPSSAELLARDYDDTDAEYTAFAVGDTVRFPLGVSRINVRAEGYEDLERMLVVAGGLTLRPVTVALRQEAEPPARMVAVPASNLDVGFIVLRGAFEPVPAPAYRIDRYEVTNAEFKAFMDADDGGYRPGNHWSSALAAAGGGLSLDDLLAEMKDSTGRPGPFTWNVGNYPPGQGDYPVAGVSWYEAAAYCEWAGKVLPTAYHWGHSATIDKASYITPVSNFGLEGLVPVGATGGVSIYGAHDMAGNVREWVWNASGEGRFILGGAFNDPEYKFYEPESRPPLDRAQGNGFRCAAYYGGTEPVPEQLTQNMPLPSRDYSREEPVSDDVFQSYLGFYAYDKAELNAQREPVADSSEYWNRETVSFDTAYGERMTAHVFLPKSGTPPYQTVVMFVGGGAFGNRRPSTEVLSGGNAEPFVKSGRAVVIPVLDGTYERNRGELASGYPRLSNLYRDYAVRWVKDYMRTLDYLDSRPDVFDADKYAFYGSSHGAQMGAQIAAIEARLKTAVLIVGGLPMQRMRAEIDTINFASHVDIPVLMLGGEYDYVFPREASQLPLYDWLGRGADEPIEKRIEIFPGVGHGVFGNEAVFNEIVALELEWLDRQLGPVTAED